MSIFDRKPVLRWLAPVAALLVVGGAGGVVAATATADDRLPSRSAAELLVDLQQVKVDAMSGTVVQESNLGIPDLPGLTSSDGASLTSLISGTHTLDVWYSGPDKARLRVQGNLDESDVIKNGSDVWTWSYKDKAATHRTLTADEKSDKSGSKAPADAPSTPQEAAEQALKAIDPTTKVSTDGTAKVAGRAAYELVLEPKDANSLVQQVRIAIDGTEHIPLRVEVLTGADKPAFEVAYTNVDFNRPDDAQFEFNPPPGTKVTQVAPAEKRTAGKAPTEKELQAKKEEAAKDTKIVGKGWSTVVVTKVPAEQSGQQAGQLTQVLNSLPKVSGDWGSGRLLSGTAFSAVLTDDGRLAVGSVKPELLYDALAK